MTLAARCPACGTVFRVVQDQLRVSEGWVRCGRCAEVFNAIDTLLEIETDLPPKAPSAPKAPTVERVMSELARVRADDVPVRSPAAPPPMPVPAPAAAVMAATAPAQPLSSIEQAAERSPLPAAAESPPPSSAPTLVQPAFVRRAEREARWRRTPVRAALATSLLLGAVVLALQIVLEYRDIAAARWPALRAPLLAACGALGCTLAPPRAIDDLAVDSSGLVRIEGTATYRLSISLRNRAAWALAAPSIDLALTDNQGATIARRVLPLSAFGSSVTQLEPGRSMPLQSALSGPDRPVSGYTIEIFYP